MATYGSSFSVFLDVSGPVLSDLDSMADKVSDVGLAKFLEDDVDPWLQSRMKIRFANEGDDAVGAWAPLSAATQNIRTSLGYGADHPINVRTGAMEAYLTGVSGDVTAGGGGAYLVFPGSSVDPLTAEKVVTAQQGKDSPPTPQRPVLGLSGIDERQIVDDLARYIVSDTQGLLGLVRRP